MQLQVSCVSNHQAQYIFIPKINKYWCYNHVNYKIVQPENSQKKKRKRKIIWFNPPYSKNVKTNVGKIFLKLLREHFPPNHKLHKIFNTNNVKISYSCMKNISSIISAHNKNILNPNTKSFKRIRQWNEKIYWISRYPI